MSEQDKAPDIVTQTTMASEADSINSNADAGNVEAQSSQASNATKPDLGLTSEQVEEFNRFMQANGGFEKAFGLIKRNISAPKSSQEPVESVSEPQAVNQPTFQPQAPQTPSEGQISMEALAVQTYMNGLASEPKYASIADDIRNGNLMREMSEGAVPIFPVSNGAVNDAQIRWYLDMKAAGAAAQQTSAAPTTTPTVDYVPVDEINSMEDASKILLQNQALRAAGKPEHPKTAEAKEFMKNALKRK